MINIIEIRENVKQELAQLKEDINESYEDVIIRLMRQVQKQKKQQQMLLIEGCKEMAEESLKICKEFDSIEEYFDWEWK